MSTNIHFRATRQVQVVKTGNIEEQAHYLDVWQTPSDVSRTIRASSNQVQAYFDWVLSISNDVEEPVYAEDDVFCESEPVGFETVNSGKAHIAELADEIQELEAAGFEIRVEAW